MACTVRGHESVIQKYLKASAVPFALVNLRHDSLGKTPCVTYALTSFAPCSREIPVAKCTHARVYATIVLVLENSIAVTAPCITAIFLPYPKP